jgi:hypothetical protein
MGHISCWSKLMIADLLEDNINTIKKVTKAVTGDSKEVV